MVITRAAPTLSGHLHLGTLYNALLNYCFAKREGGLFFLRLDGQQVSEQRKRFGEGIVRDLETFGLIPDKIIWQYQRRGLYQAKIEELISDSRIYFCDCLPGDIFERTRFNPEALKSIIREEKYPGPCEIRQFRVFSANTEELRLDIALGTLATANLEVPGYEANHITDDSEKIWKAYEVGYTGTKKPSICIDLGKEEWIGAIDIEWGQFAIKSYSIYDGGDHLLARVERPNKFYVTNRSNGPWEGAVRDQISFTPVKSRFIKLQVDDTFYEIKKEYCYDGFCRNKDKRLRLNQNRTVLRINTGNALDVAIWFNKRPDLCLTSAIDDLEFGITHSIRGIDIEPFTRLEKEAGALIEYQANNLFHGLVIDRGNVKLSKFVESPRATDYLERFTSDEILTRLAFRAGLIFSEKTLELSGLVREIDFLMAFQENKHFRF